MAEECTAKGGCQRNFSPIVMVHMQVAIEGNDLLANLRAQEIYLVWE